MLGNMTSDHGGEIKISFGYQCNGELDNSCEVPTDYNNSPGFKLRRANNSFTCLSGAALSGNATLANTNIRNGLIGAELLPTWDSPTTFRRIPSSPGLPKLEILSSSLQSSLSNLSCSPSSPSGFDFDSCSFKSMSAPSRSESFLNAVEVQAAGGAAGEDRVQAVCSEENGWLFCGIYDGFNGRDAADFLAGTLYETMGSHLNLLDWELEQNLNGKADSDESLRSIWGENDFSIDGTVWSGPNINSLSKKPCAKREQSFGSFKHRVLDSMQSAFESS